MASVDTGGRSPPKHAGTSSITSAQAVEALVADVDADAAVPEVASSKRFSHADTQTPGSTRRGSTLEVKSRPFSWALSQLSFRPRPSAPSGRRSRPISTATLSKTELVDLRAAQRTFDGAYARTALGQVSYAVVILKLFQPEFYYIGLLYTILAIGLLLVAVYRYGLAIGNIERWSELQVRDNEGQSPSSIEVPPRADASRTGIAAEDPPGASQVPSTSTATASRPIPAAQGPAFMQTFVTAGSVVGLATAGVLLVEIALMLLVLKM